MAGLVDACRLLTITLILTIGVVWPQYIPGFSTNRFFLR